MYLQYTPLQPKLYCTDVPYTYVAYLLTTYKATAITRNMFKHKCGGASTEVASYPGPFSCTILFPYACIAHEKGPGYEASTEGENREQKREGEEVKEE